MRAWRAPRRKCHDAGWSIGRSIERLAAVSFNSGAEQQRIPLWSYWVAECVVVPQSIMYAQLPAKLTWAVQSLPPSQRARVIETPVNAEPAPPIGFVWLLIGFGAEKPGQPPYVPGTEACIQMDTPTFLSQWKKL
jgi:hypothetical protein